MAITATWNNATPVDAAWIPVSDVPIGEQGLSEQVFYDLDKKIRMGITGTSGLSEQTFYDLSKKIRINHDTRSLSEQVFYVFGKKLSFKIRR